MPRHIRKGDTVMVTAGDHKGRTGVITRVITKTDRVVVQGVNVRTRHMKPTRLNPNGGIISREAAIHISNVSPVVDGKPSRVRFQMKGDGSKVRVAARGGTELGVIHSPRGGKSGSAKSAEPKPAAASKKKTSKKKTASRSKKSES